MTEQIRRAVAWLYQDLPDLALELDTRTTAELQHVRADALQLAIRSNALLLMLDMRLNHPKADRHQLALLIDTLCERNEAQ